MAAEEANNKTAANDPADVQPRSVDADSEVKRDSPEDGFSWLWKGRWWLNALTTAVLFSRWCITAALLLTVAGTVMVVGGWESTVSMRAGGVTTLQTYLTGFAICVVTLLTTAGLMLWGLGLWLLRATVYARSFMELPIDADRPLDTQVVIASQKAAFSYVAQKKAFLAKFWFYLTLLMAVPLVLLIVGVLVQLMVTPEVASALNFTLPPWLNITVQAVNAFLSVLLTETSLIGLAVCATTKQAPLEAAKQSLRLSWRWLAPGFALSILVLVINIVLASPQVLWQLFTHQSLFAMTADVKLMLVENFWQGLTSLVLWTFTAAPICQMLKGRID